jgi:hypothetical protein
MSAFENQSRRDVTPGTTNSHPVVAHWKVLCEKSGASVYCGHDFLDARWPDGRTISLRVDKPVSGVSLPRGSVVELRSPIGPLKPGFYVFWGADESSIVLQLAGEDEGGDLCATGAVLLVAREELDSFRTTGMFVDLE